MRVVERVAIVAGALLTLVLLEEFLPAKWKPYHTPVHSVSPSDASSAAGLDEWPTPQGKIIVMPMMSSENTDWVAENLPE